MDIPREKMLDLAKRIINNAYSPYSRIRVASVVYGCSQMFPGVNVENASYGLTICAERNAIFRMVTDGCRKIDAVLVYSEDIKPYPCGACRQVIAEFSEPDTPIMIVYGEEIEVTTIGKLLPKAFELRS